MTHLLHLLFDIIKKKFNKELAKRTSHNICISSWHSMSERHYQSTAYGNKIILECPILHTMDTFTNNPTLPHLAKFSKMARNNKNRGVMHRIKYTPIDYL